MRDVLRLVRKLQQEQLGIIHIAMTLAAMWADDLAQEVGVLQK